MQQHASFDSGLFGKWHLIDSAPGKLIDGGDPTVSTNALFTHPRSETGGLTLQVAYANLQNRSGGAAHVGLGVRIPTTLWKAGQWTNATTTYTDDTTDAQDVGANDFALETTTDNDGFIVSSAVKFNAICLDIGTASVTGTPVRTLEYSTGTTTWTAITNGIVMPVSGGHWTAAETLIWWIPPVDWTVLAAGHGTGVSTGQYAIRVRSTTAPTGTAGLADSMSVHRIYWSLEGLADNNVYEIPLGGMYAPLELNGDALVAAFSTANVQNRVTALVRVRG